MTLEEFKKKRLEVLKSAHYEGLINTEYEKCLIKSILGFNPTLYIDIGANNGEMIDIVKDKCEVMAFEADKRNYRVLKEKYKDIKLYNKAIYSRNGYKKLYTSNDSTQSSLTFKYSNKTQMVKCCKLDNYIKEIKKHNVIFIKIDVEGAEPDVLKGMAKILKLNKAIIIMFEYSYKWLLDYKEKYKVFENLFNKYYVVTRFIPYGLEIMTDRVVSYLSKYSYACMMAIKGINIQNDKDYMPCENGLLGFYKLNGTEVKFNFEKMNDLL